MGTNLIRAMLLASGSLVGGTAVFPAAAHAQEASYQIDIPAQALDDALRGLGRATRQNIVFDGAVVRGKRSIAVRGRLTASEALQQMLSGSGLVMARGSGGALTVRGGNGSSGAQQGRAARGQATLIGSVRDHKTGAALKGARVEVLETGDSTSTGDLGDFRFARLPTGDVTLRISYLGFPEQSETVSVVSGLNNRTDIYLGSGATSEIVVYGQTSARAQALNQERTAENSTTVISGDLLGNFNGTTISDSLRRAPGIAFQQNEATGDGTNVIVRGLSPDYNQVKLNGIALPEGSGTGRSANLSNILSDSVSEIRISKTLLANQNSGGTGGLIEIETKSPLDRPRRYFNISAEGTRRAKGFGKDYLLAATASARLTDNFGISASVQYRNQDVTTFSYSANGVPGAYLPALQNGDPASESDLDPRTPFPFYKGGEYYISSGSANRSAIKSRTSNVTLSVEWAVSDNTSLELDYVRSRRKSDSLGASYSIEGVSPIFGYSQIAPVPAEGGELRYIYGDPQGMLSANTSIGYARGGEENTDSFSFRGKSTAGPITLSYRAGYSRGATENPYQVDLITSSDDVMRIPANSSTLLSEAIDPATGAVVTFFGPRTGRGFPVPLLTAAGFEALQNTALPTLAGLSVGSGEQGRSTNWTGGLDAKYELGGGLLKYVEAGLEYTRSRFSSTLGHSINYLPGTDQTPRLSDIGFEFENLPIAAMARGQPVYRFITRQSLIGVLGNLDRLTDSGLVSTYESPDDPLASQQYTREDDLSGYVQARVDIGKLEIIGGLRIDRNRVAAGFVNGVKIYDEDFVLDQAYYDQTRVLVEGTNTVTSYLPRVLANFRPGKNLVFRAGYFSTVARPQIQQLSTESIIAYNATPMFGLTYSQPSLYITEGNPALRPARTHNFDIGGEWYDGQVGVIKLNVFLKRISNLLESNVVGGFDSLGDFELPDHPVLNNLPANIFVTYETPVNNPGTATVWGFEAAFERRLSFLPGALSGLGVYANYTYSKSRKRQQQTWIGSPVFDASGAIVDHVDLIYERVVPFDQSPRHSGTAGLTYSRRGFDASLYYTMQSRRQFLNASFNLDEYQEAVRTLDFRGTYSFKLGGADMRLSLEALNLLRGRLDPNTEHSVGGVGGTPKYYTEGSYLGGRSFALGLSATF